MDIKALVLSDLYWILDSKKISITDLHDLNKSKRKGYGSRFRSVNKYWSLVQEEQPELVLFAGDLTGDGSCGHGFHFAFLYLLSLLDQAKVQTYFIQGDNDLEKYYDIVKKESENMANVEEIPNKSVRYKNLKILGIPFLTTNHKKALKECLSRCKDMHHDILICHSALRRRTHLFTKKSDLIISGHFDNKFCSIRNSIFLSLSNDSDVINYCTLLYGTDDISISYNFLNPRRKRKISYTESASDLLNGNDKATLIMDRVPIHIGHFEKLVLPNTDYEKEKNALALSIKFLRGKNYKAAIEMMYEYQKAVNIESNELKKLMRRFLTSKHKLSKSMLTDFLGSKINSYL